VRHCLLVARSVADDGIILLDEPELHMNPATYFNTPTCYRFDFFFFFFFPKMLFQLSV
jgi:hypothetical protein